MTDWLDALRGPLPELVLDESSRRGRGRALLLLFGRGVLSGLGVGAKLGGITGAFLCLPGGPRDFILGGVVGAAAGAYCAVFVGTVIALTVAIVAATRHMPLRDPSKLHRETWVMFVVALVLLDLAFLALLRETPLFALAWAVALTALTLLLLRAPGRRLVLRYACANGWHIAPCALSRARVSIA
jgi:hypothetical protein